jgi:hypothetical protein
MPGKCDRPRKEASPPGISSFAKVLEQVTK